MKRRAVLLIILIVLLPVGLLTGIGLRMATNEQILTRQRFQTLMQERLQETNRQLAAQLSSTERQLAQLTSVDSYEIDTLREVVRTEPLVTQLFVLDPSGDLVYPQLMTGLNDTEATFLHQAGNMFSGRDLQNAVAQQEARANSSDKLGLSQNARPNAQFRQSVPTPQIHDALSSSDYSDVLVSDASAAQQQVGGLAVESPEQMADDPLGIAGAAPAENRPGNSAAGTTLAETSQAAAPEQQAIIPSAADTARETLDRSSRRIAGIPSPAISPDADPFVAGPETVGSEAGGSAQPRTQAAATAEPEMKAVQRPVTNIEPPMSANSQLADSLEFPQSSGWFVWYWNRGMNLIYWQRRPTGHIVGVSLERSRWISDLISILPDGGADSSVEAISYRLLGSASESMYEWGPPIQQNAVAFCEIPLTAPLASWRLQCFVPNALVPNTSVSAFLSLILGVSAVTLTLGAMAWILYRDFSRDLRDAAQQVSFVNQVSHELKTPLTNIRLYAELLEKDLENLPMESAESRQSTPSRRLEVITSEAQRLSRLIGNVLTFAKQKRATLRARPAPAELMPVIRQVADRFSPSLAENGIVPTVDGNATGLRLVDTDFLEQILGNLINNVEKYAAAGKVLSMTCRVENQTAVIDVKDQGPGIPVEQQQNVFRPFSRLSNDVRSASGTGIGLSIARSLAQLHGGDIQLVPSERGCHFRITLAVGPELNQASV